MDLWHQNILTDDRGRITGVLDLDRAVWATPEVEFAVLDTYGLSTPEFFAGYGSERGAGADAEIRRILYAIVELVKYPFIRHVRNQRPAAAASHKRQVAALAAALA
jgi:fructosamine-3-kinase